MPINLPNDRGDGDLARTTSLEPDQNWPLLVQIVVAWRRKDGSIAHRTRTIEADEYFGRGQYGAPMPAEALAGAVEQMRRDGPPSLPSKVKVPQRSAKAPPMRSKK